jgi:hypothetical protein
MRLLPELRCLPLANVRSALAEARIVMLPVVLAQ